MPMLDLEQKLKDDESGEFRSALLAQLQRMYERLELLQRQPSMRQTFLEIQAALEAVDGAIDTLHTVGARRLPQPGAR